MSLLFMQSRELLYCTYRSEFQMNRSPQYANVL
jgi:hypothetical protein